MTDKKWKEIEKEKRYLFFSALAGWYQWRRILHKYGLKKPENYSTAVVLLPKDDAENSYFALLYLDRMLRVAGYQKAVVLARTTIDVKAAPYLSKKIYGIEMVSDNTAEALLQYFASLIFDTRFICASLTDVKCRNGKNLLGVCGITVEDMVAIGIYRIIPHVRRNRPKYDGSDEEIARFMSLGGEYVPTRTSIKIR